MRVAVTGAAGFIGSNVTARLLEQDYEVIGIDDLSMGSMTNLAAISERKGFKFERGDVTDASLWDEMPIVDGIIHLAAKKIPRYGGVVETLKVNSLGTLRVLEFAAKWRAKTILASTSEVYGRNLQLPFEEDVSDSVIGPSTSPRWAYAVSKLFDEHLALGFQDDVGIPVTLLRFFGSYGPNQHISWWGGAPPVFIDSILRNVPVPIHGDGSQRRTFTFVDDVVDAVVGSFRSEHANGQIFNVGSEEEVSILELAHLIKKICGTGGDLDVEFIAYESFTGKPYPEVMRRVPSTEKLLSKLGISCNTTLEVGLDRTIAWQAARTT